MLPNLKNWVRTRQLDSIQVYVRSLAVLPGVEIHFGYQQFDNVVYRIVSMVNMHNSRLTHSLHTTAVPQDVQIKKHSPVLVGIAAQFRKAV